MADGATITPEDVRAYANFPSEVPETFLDQHISVATRALVEVSGANEVPPNMENHWAEALKVRALASAFPWLNTFALDGASKVGALEGTVEYRFLDAPDVEEKVKNLMTRFDELAATIKRAAEAGEDESNDQAGFGLTTLIAV